MSDTPESYFTPLSKEMMEFPCGHEGPKVYAFTIEGHPFMMDPPERTSQLDQCAQCYTQYLAVTCTHCSKCGVPIIVNSYCSHDFKDGIVCPPCITIPMFQIPSIWNGKERVPHLPTLMKAAGIVTSDGTVIEGILIKYDYKSS